MGYFLSESFDIAEGARRFLLGKRAMSLENLVSSGAVGCGLVSEMRKVELNFLSGHVELVV